MFVASHESTLQRTRHPTKSSLQCLPAAHGSAACRPPPPPLSTLRRTKQPTKSSLQCHAPLRGSQPLAPSPLPAMPPQRPSQPLGARVRGVRKKAAAPVRARCVSARSRSPFLLLACSARSRLPALSQRHPYQPHIGSPTAHWFHATAHRATRRRTDGRASATPRRRQSRQWANAQAPINPPDSAQAKRAKSSLP